MIKRKILAHKFIGTFTYLLAPILIMSILLVSKMAYTRTLSMHHDYTNAISGLALSLPLAFAFVVLYLLAVKNRKRTHAHIRYMIGTAFLMIGPGLGRALLLHLSLSFAAGVLITNLIVIGLAASFLFYDCYFKKDALPNVIVVGTLVCSSLLWEFRDSILWQSIGSFVVELW